LNFKDGGLAAQVTYKSVRVALCDHHHFLIQFLNLQTKSQI